MALDQEKGPSSVNENNNVRASESTSDQVPAVEDSQDPEPVVTFKTWIVACVCTEPLKYPLTYTDVSLSRVDPLLWLWSFFLSRSGGICHWQHGLC